MPIGEFLELIHDSGCGIYACQASVEMFGLTMEDFVPQVDGILNVGEFYDRGSGAQIVFT